MASIKEQRREIQTMLSENPSLKSYLVEAIELAYQSGIDLAVRETNLPYEAFSPTCTYMLEEVLNAEFLPGRSGDHPA